MKWFKHDTTALHDAKIEKLIMKYGIEGYGVYFACVEMIAHDIAKNNLTFELEHDAELLAHKFKIDTIKLEEIMLFCIHLGLFGQSELNGRLTCMKLAIRIDDSMVKNPEMKNIQKKVNEKIAITNNNSLKFIENQEKSNQTRLDKIRLEENRIEKNKETKHKYGEYKNVLLTDKEHAKLVDKLGTSVDNWIKIMDEGIELKGYSYKSHYLAILKWYEKENKNKPKEQDLYRNHTN